MSIEDDVIAAIAAVDRVNGYAPADTGARQVFEVDDQAGATNNAKILAAITAAVAVSGAVVFNTIYEITSTVTVPNGVMLTGGGLKRATSPRTTITENALSGATTLQVASTTGLRTGTALVNVGTTSADSKPAGSPVLITISSIDSATQIGVTGLTFNVTSGWYIFNSFAMLQTQSQYSSGIVVDSMVFDGNEPGNPWTNDWEFNNTSNSFRALNEHGMTIRNCAFFDTPSENIITNGADIDDCVSSNLKGSLFHISAASDKIARTYIRTCQGRYFNQATDAVMGHSEGAITLSAFSLVTVEDNVFLDSEEAFIAQADSQDAFTSSGNYVARMARRSSFDVDLGSDLSALVFDGTDTFVHTHWHPPAITQNSNTINTTNQVNGRTIANVSDDESHNTLVTVTCAPTAGVTVSNILNVNGAIRASLQIAVAGAPYTVLMTATDIQGHQSSAYLRINGATAPDPTLGTYADTDATEGDLVSIEPSAAPIGASGYTAAITSSTFTGEASYDYTDGTVQLSDVGPVGEHEITLTLTSGAISVQRTFTLTVEAAFDAADYWQAPANRQHWQAENASAMHWQAGANRMHWEAQEA